MYTSVVNKHGMEGIKKNEHVMMGIKSIEAPVIISNVFTIALVENPFKRLIPGIIQKSLNFWEKSFT